SASLSANRLRASDQFLRPLPPLREISVDLRRAGPLHRFLGLLAVGSARIAAPGQGKEQEEPGKPARDRNEARGWGRFLAHHEGPWVDSSGRSGAGSNGPRGDFEPFPDREPDWPEPRAGLQFLLKCAL